MGTYDRRTFLKHSAMLTAAAAARHVFPPSIIGSPLTTNQQGKDHPFFARAKNRLEVIAHRGGDLEWPGETMLAMRKAIEAGADVLEMDVYHVPNGAPNGELVLMHDSNVENTTDSEIVLHKKGSINKFTLEELQKLNAGHKWSKDGGKSHPYEKTKNLTAEVPNDLRVPTLEEVLKEFPKDTRMVIEMKKAPADFSPVERLCELIQEYGKENHVLVASFWAPFMNDFRKKLPNVATSLTLSLGDTKELGKILLNLGKNSAKDDPARPDALELPHQFLSLNPWAVNRVKSSNLALHAWTVNTRKAMTRMKKLGVDGIITDEPSTLLDLLGRAKTA